jgi:MoxR-like ATPase
VTVACLAHRMIINPENALSGDTTVDVLNELLKNLQIPLDNKL